MIIQIVYLLLAALGLGLLIFIHELAHYWMALKVGMKVEAFSIGFGKAIFSWKQQNVEWRLGWIPFGGYVKISGEKSEDGKEIHDIEGGYYNKKPWDRIKVAGIAPIVNLVVALLLFTSIWALGGRTKPFNELTNRIGYVDPNSELYAQGVRPGDLITSYNNRKVHGYKDIFQSTFLSGHTVQIQGVHFNIGPAKGSPFNVEVCPYPHPDFREKDVKTSGMMSPASYLIYQPQEQSSPISKGSPMIGSGIEAGDRIFAIDGELIFSNMQLSSMLNSNYTMLTVQRGSEKLLVRVPRVPLGELKISPDYRADLGDLKYENGLKASLKALTIIPYQINDNLEVEVPLYFLDPEQAPVNQTSNLVETKLLPKDRILAANGELVTTPTELFKAYQNNSHSIIVQSGNGDLPLIPFRNANTSFEQNIDWSSFNAVLHSAQTNEPLTVGKFKKLRPIVPLTLEEMAKRSQDTQLLTLMNEHQKRVEDIKDAETRHLALELYKKNQSKLFLGLPFQDRQVAYNPTPFTLFARTTSDVAHTLSALFSGKVNPKWMSGPIGIVQVMQHGWSLGLKEALYWLALISLNLGLFNLLPIPVLDGGQICFALWEQVTRKRLKVKTMERIVVPFMILFIGFFIFVTFHDLSRLIKGVF